jgi:hypothetical protein
VTSIYTSKPQRPFSGPPNHISQSTLVDIS